MISARMNAVLWFGVVGGAALIDSLTKKANKANKKTYNRKKNKADSAWRKLNLKG